MSSTNPVRSVCVFCGSNSGADVLYAEQAAALGAEIARRGLRLVYGGGSIGLMGAVSQAVAGHGGNVLGVIPESLAPREVSGIAPKGEVIVVQTMHERKRIMAMNSDAFIALPGGLGTLEELAEMCTWNQLGIHRKPIGVLNTKGYYDPLKTFLSQMVAERFASSIHTVDSVIFDDSVEKLLDRICAFTPPVGVVRWLHTEDGQPKENFG